MTRYFVKNISFEIYDEKIPQEELIKYINKNNIEGLVVRSATKVTEEVIKKTNNLKIIGRAGVGLDNINLKSAKENAHEIEFKAKEEREGKMRGALRVMKR